MRSRRITIDETRSFLRRDAQLLERHALDAGAHDAHRATRRPIYRFRNTVDP
jgi:hypothetical protein